jgi:hypothetical protein
LFVGQIGQVMVRGLNNVGQFFVLTTAAYNFTHLPTVGAIRLQAAQAA